MKKLFGYSIFVMIFISPFILSAHGVDYAIFTNRAGGAGIEVKYHNGEPLRHCETTIYSPAAPDEIFQKGYTDLNGRFAFFPDKAGTWKFIVNEGTGHGVAAKITVNEGLQAQINPGHGHLPLWQKIVSGIGIIGLIFTVLFLMFNRMQKHASGRL